MRNVLFIAGLDQRYYFDPFIKACKGRPMRIFVFDATRFPPKATLIVKMNSTGSIEGSFEVLECDRDRMKSTRLPISDIHVAWHLRESESGRVTRRRALVDRFVANESRLALRSLFTLLPCKWINRKEMIDFISSNKLYQQAVAGACGLTIPPTLVGNDPISVRKFSDATNGLLLKTLGYIKLDRNGRKALYSERFSHEELSTSESAIRMCPIFAQHYIDKLCEHRVMVIGDRVLSCRIDSQASELTKVDWRHYDFNNVAHAPFELPQVIQTKLKLFMKTIGLRYGAVDMIETPDNRFVFLEVNPSGQWGWIADLAGLPIPEAVADMLDRA